MTVTDDDAADLAVAHNRVMWMLDYCRPDERFVREVLTERLETIERRMRRLRVGP